MERRQLLSIKTPGASLIGVLGAGLGRIRLHRYISRMLLAALQSPAFPITNVGVIAPPACIEPRT